VALGPADAPGWRAVCADYEVAYEEGRNDVHGGVTLVHPFDVPPGADDDFVARWKRARVRLSRQRGFLGTRLHRATGPADFRFVEVARWSSPLMVARATGSAAGGPPLYVSVSS